MIDDPFGTMADAPHPRQRCRGLIEARRRRRLARAWPRSLRWAVAPSEDHTPGRLGDHLQAAATRADRRRFSLNRLLVRSAEDTVFFRDDRPWVAGFITKNRHFRVDTEVVKASAPGAPARFRQGIVASYRREARRASVRERGLG